MVSQCAVRQLVADDPTLGILVAATPELLNHHADRKQRSLHAGKTSIFRRFPRLRCERTNSSFLTEHHTRIEANSALLQPDAAYFAALKVKRSVGFVLRCKRNACSAIVAGVAVFCR